jgi:FMN phosphatase YigB (HAD superfamily)
MIDPFLKPCTVDAILFDFGGVLAEEGFRNGLLSIAKHNGLEPEPFTRTGFELVFEVAYVIGRSDESTFWQALREQTGIRDTDETLRKEILSHFRLRAWMIELVKKLKHFNVRLAILSDQANWLDELDMDQEPSQI